MKPFLLPLLFITTIAQAQDTTFNYGWMSKCVVIYSSSQVYKKHTWDTLDFKGAVRPFYVRDAALYLPAPVSDSFIISSHNGDWQKDTILSYGFKGGATGFYVKGQLNADGSVYDYFNIYYPDRRLPNGDIERKDIKLIITKKTPKYSD